MNYAHVVFSRGIDAEGYIEFDDSTGSRQIARYTDMSGNTLSMPKIYEISVIESDCPKPAWGT